MTLEEFLEIHPDEDIDLQVPEGRVLLDHGQTQRLLDGRPVIVCKTGVQDAQYVQAEDLLTQVVYLAHQTHGPVSYTHLDVYKRQRSPLGALSERAAWKFTMITTAI